MQIRHENGLEEAQRVIRARDSEIAAKVELSTETYRRAKKGATPIETTRLFLNALETLRLERIDCLTRLKVPAAG